MKVVHLIAFALCSVASCLDRVAAQDEVPVPRSFVRRVLVEACASGDIETVLVLVPRCRTLDSARVQSSVPSSLCDEGSCWTRKTISSNTARISSAVWIDFSIST